MYNPKRTRAGDVITSEMWNALQAELKRLGQVRVAGMTMHNGPGGLTLGVAFPDGARIAKTGGSGIPARSGATVGVGDVTFYTLDGDTLVAGAEDTAINLAAAAVGANQYVQVKRVSGRWCVDFEDCPTG
jgi:hypothetical protein